MSKSLSILEFRNFRNFEIELKMFRFRICTPEADIYVKNFNFKIGNSPISKLFVEDIGIEPMTLSLQS
jgi:hypothetical protein